MKQVTDHFRYRQRYRDLVREVWGTNGMERRAPQGARLMWLWRQIEERAIAKLPDLGFTEVDCWSRQNNQVMVDIVATDRHGRRCLLDITSRLQARFPEKARFAASLRMPLYILFASPEQDLFIVQEVPKGATTLRLPMGVIRQELANARFRREHGLWPYVESAGLVV